MKTRIWKLVMLGLVVGFVLGGCKAPSKSAVQPKKSARELIYDDTKDLSALQSYRLMNTVTFQEEGAEGGTIQMEMDYVQDPPAQRILLRGQGVGTAQGGAAGEIEIVRVGKDSYARYGDKDWIAMQVPDEQLMPPAGVVYRPENVFHSATGRYVGREQVNNEETEHYVFDKEALARSGIFEAVVEASGEVWVSTKHNVVVRAVARIKGRDAKSGKRVTIDLRSDVMDINSEIEIKPPEGVQKPEVPEDVPLPAETKDLLIMLPMISFKISMSADEITRFYEKEMGKRGWIRVQSPIPGFVAFEKGNRTVQIALTAQGGQTSVAIVLGEK